MNHTEVAAVSPELRENLARLGVERFVLGMHACSFPAGAWDTGYGAPFSAEGERVLRFAANLGFNALQLGPSGVISELNLSPYDGTVFARNPWTLGIEALTRSEYGALLTQADALLLGAADSSVTERVDAPRAARVLQRVLDLCYQRFVQRRRAEPEAPVVRAFEAFVSGASTWLGVDAAYEAIAARAGDDPSRFEPALRADEGGPRPVVVGAALV